MASVPRPPLLCVLSLLGLGVVALGCEAGLSDARFATGSSTLAATDDAVYALDSDSGLLARLDATSGEVVTVRVGDEPGRLALLGGRLVVSLRTERALAVAVYEAGILTLQDRVDVGAEPMGLVASEDGSRLYVALSMEDRVLELDEDLALLRSWAVPFEPRWPALHPSGDSLYVGSTFDGAVAWIDLRETDPARAVHRIDLVPLTGRDLETDAPIVLSRRVTGDLSVSPGGDLLAVPTLYVDNLSEVGEPNLDARTSTNYDAATADNDRAAGRFSPVAVLVPLDAHGEPSEPASAVALSALPEDSPARRSYPASVTFSPDGQILLATLEAAHAVVAVPANPVRDARGTLVPAPLDEIGAERRPLIAVVTEGGPRAIAFTESGRAFVHAFLSRSVADLRFGTLDRLLPRDGEPTDAALSAHDAVTIADHTIPAAVRAGRRLFYASDDRRVAGAGSGVSCSTCHFDGRTDGLTWPLVGLPRQTPSLAGEVSLTAPVTWSEEVATVVEEVIITSQGRMGGRLMTDAEASDVAAYIEWTRLPDLPEQDPTDVAAGRAIFEREDVGCAECHSGPAYTDNEPHEMFGEPAVRTRTLLGIAATAPYLHDGSVSSLGALLERVQDGSMGDTGSVTPAERRQLEAFLRSL